MIIFPVWVFLLLGFIAWGLSSSLSGGRLTAGAESSFVSILGITSLLWFLAGHCMMMTENLRPSLSHICNASPVLLGNSGSCLLLLLLSLTNATEGGSLS